MQAAIDTRGLSVLCGDGMDHVFQLSSDLVKRIYTERNEAVVGYRNGSIFVFPSKLVGMPDHMYGDMPPLFSGINEDMTDFAIMHSPTRIVLSYNVGSLQVWELSSHYRAWLRRDVVMHYDMTPLSCWKDLRWDGNNIVFQDREEGVCTLKRKRWPFCDPYWAP